MTAKIREPVLLTGAGFTHNFGGFLADQMWARIFNHEQVQKRSSLVTLLKDNFDFESAYNEVMDGNSYTSEDQLAVNQAVKSAYDQLDETIRNCWGPACPISHQGMGSLLEAFASNGQGRGYIFTLNQDFLVERWHSGTNKILRTPGVGIQHLSPFTNNSNVPPYTVPQDITAEKAKYDNEYFSSLLYYVKLHGSMNWQTGDGRGVLVIGGDKPGQIYRQPLLQWYFELFKKVLSSPNRRLLVIGYGFRDTHVNEVIAQAIREDGLPVYVISPKSPRDFKRELLKDPNEDKKILWQGLAGYWDWALKDVCPANQSYFAEEVRKAIFQY